MTPTREKDFSYVTVAAIAASILLLAAVFYGEFQRLAITERMNDEQKTKANVNSSKARKLSLYHGQKRQGVYL